MGDQITASAVGQAGNQRAKPAQAQRASQVIGRQAGHRHMQGKSPAKGVLDRHEQKEDVGRVESAGLQIGSQRGARAQVRVPQRP